MRGERAHKGDSPAVAGNSIHTDTCRIFANVIKRLALKTKEEMVQQDNKFSASRKF